MPRNVLQSARRLYRRRKFPQLIRLLESQIFRFRENPEFFFLLGSSCLRSGDLGGAESYLRRADQLRPQDAPTLASLAAIHFRRGEDQEALELWLQITGLEAANRQAARGLALLRRAAATENPQALQEARADRRILPALPPDPRALVLPLLGAAAAGLLAAGLVFGLPLLQHRPSSRPEILGIQLSTGQPALTASPEGARIVLTEKEVQETFERVRRYLLQYRDNLALREVNRLLLSNASPYVKEKARMLGSFTRVPDFSTIRDSFSYREVAADPALYAGCYVVWSGKAANMRVGKEKILFDLLVGYADEKQLEGVVPVTVGFAVRIEDGSAVEVLGRVGQEGAALEAVSLHPLHGVR